MGREWRVELAGDAAETKKGWWDDSPGSNTKSKLNMFVAKANTQASKQTNDCEEYDDSRRRWSRLLQQYRTKNDK